MIERTIQVPMTIRLKSAWESEREEREKARVFTSNHRLVGAYSRNCGCVVPEIDAAIASMREEMRAKEWAQNMAGFVCDDSIDTAEKARSALDLASDPLPVRCLRDGVDWVVGHLDRVDGEARLTFSDGRNYVRVASLISTDFDGYVTIPDPAERAKCRAFVEGQKDSGLDTGEHTEARRASPVATPAMGGSGESDPGNSAAARRSREDGQQEKAEAHGNDLSAVPTEANSVGLKSHLLRLSAELAKLAEELA